MKFIKILIILILSFSCSNQKQSEQRILEFENILGVENSKTLSYLINDFENDFLKKQYPNLKSEDAYKVFLIELRDGKTINGRDFSNKSREYFNASKLKQDIYQYPDSVWILKNSEMDKIEADSMLFLYDPYPYIKLRYKDLNKNGTYEYSYSRIHTNIKPNSNFDSIITRRLKIPEYNYSNKYMQALYAVKETDTLIKKYFDLKQNGGSSPSDFFARGILELNPDFNDYFHKRIVVMELIY